MICRQIKPGLWDICAVEKDARVFRNDSFTEHGMMFHSYLMETGEGFLLLGTLPARYMSKWIAQVNAITRDRIIHGFVVFGASDERIAVNLILKEYPNLMLIGAVSALYQLEGFLDHAVKTVSIRGERDLCLGGKALQLLTLPGKTGTSNIYIVDRSEHLLFTADAFGANYGDSRVLTSEISDKAGYLHSASQYYTDISGEDRHDMLAYAVSLVRKNRIDTICPTIGPVVDSDIEKLLKIYEWEPSCKIALPTVALLYTNAGYVGELMSFVAAGIKDSGRITAERIDLCAVSRETAIRKAARADALLFGAADGRGEAKAIWDVITSLSRNDCEGKTAAAVYNFQSKDHDSGPLRMYLASLGFDMNTSDYIVQGKPDAQTLKKAYEYGYAVGCSLLKIPNPHKPKLVKCLVCGEIFDASLGICPVCGVGLEQCVPVDEEFIVFKRDTHNRYVILGGGIAAVSAAEAIRSRDDTGSILMLSAESCLPINRPMLTKDLRTVTTSPESLFIHDKQWYDEQRICLRLGCTVSKIDPHSKKIMTADGNILCYDKLIYAMGAECFVPPFPGHDKQGIITVRHLSDALKLGTCLHSARNAVVIGGGVLGLEAASELMRAGVKITILEATPQIIGRQIDAASAAALKKTIESMGAACYEGVSIAAIEGDAEVSGVRLSDGRFFSADFVVVSCGNRANVKIAKAAGIAVERAIVVDQHMQTSVPDIYACGDCAQFNGVNLQLWQEASGQGRIAGANAVGDRLCYTNQLLGLSLEGFGTTMFAIGDPGKQKDIPYRAVSIRDNVIGRLETYWFSGSSLEGAVLIRASEKVGDVSRAVTVHAQYAEMF